MSWIENWVALCFCSKSRRFLFTFINWGEKQKWRKSSFFFSSYNKACPGWPFGYCTISILCFISHIYFSTLSRVWFSQCAHMSDSLPARPLSRRRCCITKPRSVDEEKSVRERRWRGLKRGNVCIVRRDSEWRRKQDFFLFFFDCRDTRHFLHRGFEWRNSWNRRSSLLFFETRPLLEEQLI